MEYEFTKDWFSWAPQMLTGLEQYLPEKGKRILEIGAFEGRATVWFIEKWLDPDGCIICVDTWAGGADHAEMDIDWDKVKTRFKSNTHAAFIRRGKDLGVEVLPDMDVFEAPSHLALADLVNNNTKPFHFIYIDGSHRARDVLADAVVGWQLLAEGGIMLFDDYLWGDPSQPLDRPKPAIDAFTNIYADEMDVVGVGYQLAVRKRGK